MHGTGARSIWRQSLRRRTRRPDSASAAPTTVAQVRVAERLD